MIIRRTLGMAILSLCTAHAHADGDQKMLDGKLRELREVSNVVLKAERKPRGLSADERRELLALIDTLRGDLKGLLGPGIGFSGSHAEPHTKETRSWERVSEELAIFSIELWYGETEALRYEARAKARATITRIRDSLKPGESWFSSYVGTGLNAVRERKFQKIEVLLSELQKDLDFERELPDEKIHDWLYRLDSGSSRPRETSFTPTLQIFQPGARGGE